MILETCEIDDLASIYKLSYLSLLAGADFIKTSTGKGKHGAKMDHFVVMVLALRDYLIDENIKTIRGIKPAGGISTSQDAWKFMSIVDKVLGSVHSGNFRIGASSLAANVLKDMD